MIKLFAMSAVIGAGIFAGKDIYEGIRNEVVNAIDKGIEAYKKAQIDKEIQKNTVGA